MKDFVFIFECCFLQNPLTTMLAYHNMDEEYINDHSSALAEIIKSLNPLLIFLEPKDIRKNFDLIKEKRSKEWLEFITDYVTNQ